jgi:hypothetical protein
MSLDRSTGLTLFFLLTFVASSVSAGEALMLVSPAEYKDGIMVSDAVRAECELPDKVPAYIVEAVEDDSEVTLADASVGTSGRVLRVMIDDVMVSGFGGPKALTISGELRENGKVIGTIRARRTTSGGAFGAFQGVCGMLRRCANTLGKDIAAWLEAPAMDVVKTN